MYYTHDAFRALPFSQHIMVVWEEGRDIATRYEEENAVCLYRMQGKFFVELFVERYYDQYANEIVKRTSTFADDEVDRLTDYSHYIRLDDPRIP